MHENHRDRMRQRYLTAGFRGFAPHELLEMLLYSAIPRGDTNETAHLLFERFGSLHGIFEATPEELMEVPGIGPQAAVLLELLPEITRRYAAENMENVKVYDTVKKVADYFCARFIGLGHECLYLMLLNNRANIIDCVCVSEGTVNSAAVPFRRIVELALSKKASIAVLAHNHPNGLALPSQMDLEVTDQLNQLFGVLGIHFLEHIIICGANYWPILRKHEGVFPTIPPSDHLEHEFLDHFYDIEEDGWCTSPIFPPEKNEGN